MIPIDLSLIRESDLQRLCADKAAENQTLEFKVQLPTPSENSEIMKDICALANSDGGDLIYGIAEVAACASRIIPLSGAPDSIMRRVSQVADGIEPRIPDITLKAVETSSGGICLVVRVPRSFDGPHSFPMGAARRFVLRNGTNTADMTITQIRDAFDRTSTLVERAENFLDRRTDAVASGATWRSMDSGPLAYTALVPLATQSRRVGVNIAAINREYGPYVMPGWHSVSRAMNIDGIVVHPTVGRDTLPAYTQVFRSGAAESLRIAGHHAHPDVLPSLDVTRFFRSATIRLIRAAQGNNINGPALLRTALFHVHGYKLGVGGHEWDITPAKGDRPHLIPPDLWIEALDSLVTDDHIDGLLAPHMDIIWQSFDVEKCVYYDENAKWTKADR